MANLYGKGCPRCNKEIAAALRDMPLMDGYLDTQGYSDRYGKFEASERPVARIDGVFKPNTVATVAGDDGWLLAFNGGMTLCACGSDGMEYELWRGNVEIR